MKKTLTITASLAACAILGYLLLGSDPSHEDEHDHHSHEDEFLHFPPAKAEEHGITMNSAESGNLKFRARAPAEIVMVSDKVAHVLPKVSGIALAAYKNIGDSVEEGEVIATLESKEMAEAKSDYLCLRKKEKLASDIFKREASLYEKKLASAQEYNEAESGYEEAVIELELARQKLFTLGLTRAEIEQLPQQSTDLLRIYEIKAPLTGKIVERHLTSGEFVTTDAEVFVVADLSYVWAEAKIFPQDRQHVTNGQEVNILSNFGLATKGVVSFLSPVIDKETRTSTALVKIDNANGQWLPGSYVQAEFITNEVPVATLVAKDSIQNIDGVDVVFVASDDGFIVQPVTIGLTDDDFCEVLSGLDPGTPYACTKTFLLKADLKKDEAEHMD